jgi:hypothetical protein
MFVFGGESIRVIYAYRYCCWNLFFIIYCNPVLVDTISREDKKKQHQES